MEIQNLTKISETCKPYICDKCPTFYFPSQNSALSIVSNFEIFLEDIHMCTFRARTIWEWIVARARMSDVWVSRLCLLHKSSHVWDWKRKSSNSWNQGTEAKEQSDKHDWKCLVCYFVQMFWRHCCSVLSGTGATPTLQLDHFFVL